MVPTPGTGKISRPEVHDIWLVIFDTEGQASHLRWCRSRQTSHAWDVSLLKDVWAVSGFFSSKSRNAGLFLPPFDVVHHHFGNASPSVMFHKKCFDKKKKKVYNSVITSCSSGFLVSLSLFFFFLNLCLNWHQFWHQIYYNMRWKSTKSDTFYTSHSNSWINSCNLWIMCKGWRLFILLLPDRLSGKKDHSVECWTNIPDKWGELPIASTLTLFIQHALTKSVRKRALISPYLLLCSIFSGRKEKIAQTTSDKVCE